MLENYLPILLQLVIAAGFAVVTLIASALLGKSAKRNTIKDSASASTLHCYPLWLSI